MKTYWVGVDKGKIITNGTVLVRSGYDDYSGSEIIRTHAGLRLYKRKKDAKLYFDDVRKVKIVEGK